MTKFTANHSQQQQNSNETCKMPTQHKMMTIKHCIKLLVHVKISVDSYIAIYIVQFQKNTNFCTPLLYTVV